MAEKMNFDISKYIDPLIIAAILIGGFITGIIVSRFTRSRLSRIAATNGWEYASVIIKKLNSVIIISFVLISLTIAETVLSFNQKLVKVLDTTSLIIIILIVTAFVSQVLVGLLNTYYEKKNSDHKITSIFANITRLVIFITGTLIVLNSLGVSIAPILTALGVGGLAVSLALQDTLSNLFAGINILSTGKIKVGDRIKFESEEGLIEDISWRHTSIKLLNENVLIVPNAKIAASVVMNYSLPDTEFLVTVNASVVFGSDLEKVESAAKQAAIDVMNEFESGIENYIPKIQFREFGESGVVFSTVLRCSDISNVSLLKHHMIKLLHKKFADENIKMPFPTRTVIIQEKK